MILRASEVALLKKKCFSLLFPDGLRDRIH